jgi:NAD(P)-dependent dehydrogenase (short-subunit alcohol dehydrogenase family)
MPQLSGKIALITGGGTGIGLASAKRFVREGAYVFIVGRRQRALDDAVEVIGKNVAAVQGDVTHAGDIDRVFESVRAAKGKLDTLVVDAGIAEPSRLDTITEAHFDKTFDLNARAALFTVQKAVPLMAKQSCSSARLQVLWEPPAIPATERPRLRFVPSHGLGPSNFRGVAFA